ncbi:MAG: peptidoglycan-binding protein [Clostridia bacterium]|nr:peptidoglycan-binding protein [Clostridia bacterium]
MKKVVSVFLAALCLLTAMTSALALMEVRRELPELPLKKGDSIFDVYNLKRALYAMGFKDVNDHRDHPRYAPEFTYEFDKHMVDAVLEVQKAQGLETTGEVDEKTMEAILPGYLDAIQNGALMLGTMSEEVRTMQENLKALGYYNGDITGNFGEITEGGVMAFQKANGLTVNGFAGDETLAVIESKMQTLGGE